MSSHPTQPRDPHELQQQQQQMAQMPADWFMYAQQPLGNGGGGNGNQLQQAAIAQQQAAYAGGYQIPYAGVGTATGTGVGGTDDAVMMPANMQQQPLHGWDSAAIEAVLQGAGTNDGMQYGNVYSMAPTGAQGFPQMVAAQQQQQQQAMSQQPSSAAPPATSIPAAVTEFTRRKNWTSIVLNTLPTWLFALGPTGRVLYGSPASRELLGHSPAELVGRSLTDYVHVDDVDTFVREFRRCMRKEKDDMTEAESQQIAQDAINATIYGSAAQSRAAQSQQKSPMLRRKRRETRVFLRFRGKDDRHVVLEVTGRGYFSREGASSGTDDALAFFGAARNYPVRVTAMFDQFLELRAENEALKRRIAELNTAGFTASGNNAAGPSSTGVQIDYNLLYGQAQDAQGEGGNAMADDSRKKTRSSAPNVGLEGFFVAGEAFTRSAVASLPVAGGIGMAESGSGAAGGPPAASKLSTNVQNRVCTDCGTTESPEWRKGPTGPKSLCNACGLRWAKRVKKDVEMGGAAESIAVGTMSTGTVVIPQQHQPISGPGLDDIL